MSDAHRRETLVGRLAASALDKDAAEAQGCPDAARLAEWHDGAPGSPARADLMAHVASCSRCQEILASLVRMADEVPVPAAQSVTEPARRALWPGGTAWRWMLPASAALAAATVWFIVRPPAGDIGKPAGPATQVAQSRPSKEVVPPVITLEQAPPRADEAGAMPPERPHETPQAQAKASRGAGPSVVGGILAVPPSAPAPLQAPVAVPAPAKAEAERLAASEATVPTPREARAFPGAAEPKAALRAPADAEPRENTLQAKAVTMRDLAAGRPSVLVAGPPESGASWRIGPGNRIARSQDGGRTWESRDLAVAGAVLAGAAVSRDVCWLVGLDGLVLRTADGSTWERVEPPDGTDLVRVEARTARAATVTSAAGRRFATEDGGKTWRRLAG